MALAYLGSWLPSFRGGGSAPLNPAEQAIKPLTEEELNELHQQWVRMQSSHQQQAEGLVGRLVQENEVLKARIAATERELRDVKAGRKEEEEMLRKAEKEIERLGGGKTALAVAILDLELDLILFHHADPGRYAAEVMHARLRSSLPPEDKHETWQFLVLILWHRRPEFVKALIAQGLISSIADLDDFINGFNRAHPLFLVVVTSTSSEMTLQRQRALATVYARNPICQRLILGRWALDLHLAETIAPSKGTEKVVFPLKVLFVEPYPGFYLLPQLRKREPQIVEMGGVLRRFPLGQGGGGRDGRAVKEVDYSKPLWKQTPPICLDFYLSPSRCTDERCTFSHSYKIPRQVLDALRFDLSRQPCPLAIAGLSCLDEEACFFAHVCPRGEACPRRGCSFTAPTMHPRQVPQAPPQPVVPLFKQQPVTTAASPPPPVVPAQTAPSSRQSPQHRPLSSPTKPPSTRSALERMLASSSSPKLAGASPSPRPPSPSKPSSPLKPSSAPLPPSELFPTPSPTAPAAPHHLKHPTSLASPFGHPLSLADLSSAHRAGLADPAALAFAQPLVDLSDAELQELLEKAKKEEEEYEKGLREDPFFSAASGGGEGGRGGGGGGRQQERRESSLFGSGEGGGNGNPRVGAQAGDGRAIWEAAKDGRGAEKTV
ncbi:hypothetical protein JCM8547_009420 [Rhodosporidiobolus lusitaniae]